MKYILEMRRMLQSESSNGNRKINRTLSYSQRLRTGALLTLFFLLTVLGPEDIPADCISPISLWRLEESSESIEFLNDINPGTAVATCRQEDGGSICPQPEKEGRYGAGQRFYVNGQRTGIEIPANPIFNWQTNHSFSISLWMKRDKTPSPSDNEVFIGRDLPDNSLHWWIGINKDGCVNAYFRDRGGEPYMRRTSHMGSDKLLLDNRWHYIVFTRDWQRSESRLYVDGVLEDKLAFRFHAYHAFSDDTAPVTIGWSLNDNEASAFFKGALDEIALYDKALPSWFVYDRYQADERYRADGSDPCE